MATNSDMDADDVPDPDELEMTSGATSSSIPSLEVQLEHLINRGVSVLHQDHTNKQNDMNSSLTVNFKNSNLDYGKQKLLKQFSKKQQLSQKQQRQQQTQILQLQAQQQHVQLQNMQNLNSNIKDKDKNMSAAITLIASNSDKKRRKQDSAHSSTDSLNNSTTNLTPLSRTNQFALLKELDITHIDNVSLSENTTPVSNSNGYPQTEIRRVLHRGMLTTTNSKIQFEANSTLPSYFIMLT